MNVSSNGVWRRLLAAGGMAVLLAGIAPAPSAQTPPVSITFPDRVGAGPDYATDVLADPWDMSNPADISIDPLEHAGWSTFGMSGGLLGGTINHPDANTTFLYRGFYGIVNPVRSGLKFPIDPNRYRKLAFKMRSTVSGQNVQVYWFHRPLGDPAGLGDGVRFAGATDGGEKLHVADLSESLAGGEAWATSLVRGLRVDPNSGATGQEVYFDWVRLTAGDGTAGAAMQTIGWTGGGTANIQVRDAASAVLTIATGVSGNSYDWNYGILPPGSYTLIVTNSSGTSEKAFTVNHPPTIQITDPDEAGGEDFATAVLGNAWDMDLSSDIRASSRNLTNVSFSSGQFHATSTSNDPTVILLDNTNNGVPIDTTKYRYLTYRLLVDEPYSLGLGSVVRVFWGSVQDAAIATTTKDIIVWPGMNSYTIDLASLTVSAEGGLENSGAKEPWTSGHKRHFRLDPHEFSTARAFHLDDVKLAAMDQADGSFTIRWTGTDGDAGDAPTVTLYYDDDTNSENGKTQIVSGVALSAGQYSWSTSNVTPGVYYIYAEALDGWNTYGAYSTGSVQVASATVTPDPLMSIDSPANGVTLTQPFLMAGWAIDRGGLTGTGVDTVHIWAFPASGSPVFVGVANYFARRDDVAAAFGSRFTNSGYNLVIGTLAPGTYTIAAYAHSTVSNSFNQSQSVTVTIPASLPRMSLDVPAHDSTITSPVTVSGWAIDQTAPSGTGVDDVRVYAFPRSGASAIFMGFATYGIARGDVGAAFGSQFTNSGYFLKTSIPPDSYTIVAYAHSTVAGAFNNERGAEVIVSGTTTDPLMSIDTPTSGSTRTQPFNTAGWAIDRAASSGTGVDTIHVWAWPVGGGSPSFIGVADYGASRPDVGGAFGSQFTNSGYNFATFGLTPGVYDIVVYVRSSVTGTFNNSQTVRITVQ